MTAYPEVEKAVAATAAAVSERFGSTASSLASNSPFDAFIASFVVTVVSEIGDKTFFIAAVLAMHNSRMQVFASAFAALLTMTVLSAVVGHVAPLLLSHTFSQLAAAILFTIFGVKMLHEAAGMTGNEGQEDLLEVTNEIGKSDERDKNLEEGQSSLINAVSGANSASKSNTLFSRIPKVCIKAFVMTFLGEWGDRSQIATVALASSLKLLWVIVGSLSGHALCTGIAVIGGRMLASRISVKTVNIIGGVLFLIFGIGALLQCAVELDFGRTSMRDPM